MLKNYGNTASPNRPDSSMFSGSYKLEAQIPRTAMSKFVETSFQSNQQNNCNEALSKRSQQTLSPARASLTGISLNQYDTISVKSRFDEIKRKYDGQLKRIQQHHTPPREQITSITSRRQSEQIIPQRSPISEAKLHGISRSTWQTKQVHRTCQSIMGSASKQREMDFSIDQEVRRSMNKLQDLDRVRSKSRNTSSFVSDAPNFGRSHDKYLDDPRVQSIDKINQKIKQILNSLGETKEVKEGISINQGVTKYQANQINRPRDVYRQVDYKVEKALAIEERIKKPITSSFITNNQRPSLQGSVKMSQREEPRRYSVYDKKQNQRGQSLTVIKNELILDKSLIKRDNGECLLKSGKDVDEQIRKIQQKIKKSEEQRRRLNIKFETSKDADLGIYERRAVAPVIITATSFQPSSKITQRSISTNRQTATNINTAKKVCIDESPSFKKLPNSELRARQGLRSAVSKKQVVAPTNSTSAFTLQKASTNRSSARQTGCSTVGSAVSSTTMFKEEDRFYGPKRTYEIKQPKQNQKSGPLSDFEIKRLVQRLKQQVVYDQQLRNSKLNFAAINDPDRWQRLGEELRRKGISLTEQQLKVEFELSLDEHNPFYSVRQTHQSPESIASKYIAANQYWNKYLFKKFDSRVLQSEGLKSERIDLERKGYLTTQDFVRFMNIESGKFYRNRDLVMILRRISSNPRISFEDFINTVCH